MKKNYSVEKRTTQTVKKSSKSNFLFFLLFIISVAHANAQLPSVYIPDVKFRNALLNNHNIDTDNDDIITPAEAAAFTGTINASFRNIGDLTGIEAFVNIKGLDCSLNALTSLDVSANTALTSLDCGRNPLTSLDVSANTALTNLSCNFNGLTSLDVSANTALTGLTCSDNSLTSLDVSANTYLSYLSCQNNALTSLDVSNTSLIHLMCSNNALTSLNATTYNNFLTFSAENNPNLSCIQVHDVNLVHPIGYLAKDTTAIFSTDCSPIVYIPDANFKNALLSNTSINTDNDTEISYNEAAAFTGTMDVSFYNIADLTGIEAFVNITKLFCFDNALASLDVSANTALTDLRCTDNVLTSLDVSANTTLTGLYCSNNALTSLDIANGNNMNFTYFKAIDNPNLSCIQVDDVTYSNTNWTDDIDTTARFSTDCSIVYIPDANFKNALLSNTSINTDNDTEISYNEAAAFTGTMDVSFNNIADLTGIEAFVNITRLYCNYNNLTSLEVANNLALEELRCYSNNLTSLDVSVNTALTRLICYDNALTSLDVSANTTLTSLYCSNNALTSLNVANGNNTNLITFIAENNPDLSCIQVDDVTYSNANWANDIDDTAIFSTDCPIVYIPDANFKNVLLSNTSINTDNDTEISYNEAVAFTGTMDVSFNNIADLTGIEAFVNITRLYCYYNNLTSLEVANNLALEELRCNGNNLTSIDVSVNTALTRLICYDNALTSLDVSANTTLTGLYCSNNALTSLNVANGNNMNFIYFNATNNPDLSCIQVDDVTYSNTNWANDIDDTASFSTDCPIVYIPDANFKNALLSNTSINTNNDMEISYNEAAAFTGTMDVNSKDIADLKGIEAFVNITGLDCRDNALTSLDVSANTALTALACSYNSLTSLDVSANIALTWLICYDNALTSLDVSANTALSYLSCSTNALTSLDVSANTALTFLNCFNNALTSLDVSANTALTSLVVSTNALTSLDVSANTALTRLHCDYNALTSLDVSANTALTLLWCFNNALTSLDVSASTALTDLSCNNNALTSLDVSASTALTLLWCYNNALTSLNIANGNNTNVYSFLGFNNPNLSCIQVDDVTYSNTNWAYDIDDTASFSTDCNYLSTFSVSSKTTTTTKDVADTSSIVTSSAFTETVRVSPNPVINTFSITGSASFKLKQAKVYNILSEEVLSSTNNQVDASSLPTGMYILKIESTDGKIQTKKVIKK